MCTDVHLCMFVCPCKRERAREMALSDRFSLAHNHGQQIRDNLSYSLFHRPWIPKREKRERKMQTASQPPQQALFTLSHNLLALTDYPTSLGPTFVVDSAGFALLPSDSLALSLCIFYGSPGIQTVSYFHQTKIWRIKHQVWQGT